MGARLGIIELLTRIGEDHVHLQNLFENATNFAVRGKRGRQHTEITFTTSLESVTPTEIFQGKQRNVGLVLWLPADRVQTARAAWLKENGGQRDGTE